MFLKFAEDAVFMANGVFLENNACIKFKQCEAVFVTVFPLNPALLPYTVKITGSSVSPCSGLVTVVTLDKCRFLALFERRFSYVFSKNDRCPCDCSPVGEFFTCVKKNDMEKARTYMTGELSSSVENNALASFLAPYKSVIKDERFLSDADGSFLFIDDDNVAHPMILSVKNNLIDDITEK